MGLFNLAKKRDIPLPPRPTFSEPGLQQDKPLQANEIKEEIDFTEFSDEVPIPPSDLSFAQVHQDKPASLGAKPLAGMEIQELPSIDLPGQTNAKQESVVSSDKVIYELPDFLDEESKAVKEPKQVEQKKEPEKKQASQGLAAPEKSFLKPEPVKPKIPPVQVKPKIYPTQEKIEIYSEPVKPKETKMRIEAYEPIPYAEKPKPSAPLLKEPFMDISRYFELKEDFETIRKLIATTQDKLEHEAMLSKEKSDKHQAVAETINYLQEKLMLMDTKLFES